MGIYSRSRSVWLSSPVPEEGSTKPPRVCSTPRPSFQPLVSNSFRCSILRSAPRLLLKDEARFHGLSGSVFDIGTKMVLLKNDTVVSPRNVVERTYLVGYKTTNSGATIGYQGDVIAW